MRDNNKARLVVQSFSAISADLVAQLQTGFLYFWRLAINKPPAFQFYPKDFLMDDKVIVMNLEEIGAYIKLLCLCWNNNGLTKDQKD